MATVSKSNKPRKAPNLTRNGRVRITSLGLDKLNEHLTKVSRPKDKDKIQRRINNLIKRGFTVKTAIEKNEG